MEVLFLVIIIGLLAANLYFVTKKDAPEDEKNDEYLIKGIVSEIIENEESQIYKLLNKLGLCKLIWEIFVGSLCKI